MDPQLSRDIVATLHFATKEPPAHSTEKPYALNLDLGHDVPQTNTCYEGVPGIRIHDLRHSQLTYPDNGILVKQLDSKMTPEDFSREETIKRVYLPEIETLLKHALGATRVLPFNWQVRSRSPSFPFGVADKVSGVQPAVVAHIDFTTEEVADRVSLLLGENADDTLGRQYEVVNVWKPILGPVRDWPMAFCDARTLDTKRDLMKFDDVFESHLSEIYQVHYNRGQTWYYLPEQEVSEVVIFNCCDSHEQQERSVAHCSFSANDYFSGPPRQSIEVRAFVIYEGQAG